MDSIVYLNAGQAAEAFELELIAKREQEPSWILRRTFSVLEGGMSVNVQWLLQRSQLVNNLFQHGHFKILEHCLEKLNSTYIYHEQLNILYQIVRKERVNQTDFSMRACKIVKEKVDAMCARECFEETECKRLLGTREAVGVHAAVQSVSERFEAVADAVSVEGYFKPNACEDGTITRWGVVDTMDGALQHAKAFAACQVGEMVFSQEQSVKTLAERRCVVVPTILARVRSQTLAQCRGVKFMPCTGTRDLFDGILMGVAKGTIIIYNPLTLNLHVVPRAATAAADERQLTQEKLEAYVCAELQRHLDDLVHRYNELERVGRLDEAQFAALTRERDRCIVRAKRRLGAALLRVHPNRDIVLCYARSGVTDQRLSTPVFRRSITTYTLVSLLIGSTDGHSGNIFIDNDGGVTGIDWAQSFPPELIDLDKNILDYYQILHRGRECMFSFVPHLPRVVERATQQAFLALQADKINELLKDFLTPYELHATQMRLKHIQAHLRSNECIIIESWDAVGEGAPTLQHLARFNSGGLHTFLTTNEIISSIIENDKSVLKEKRASRCDVVRFCGRDLPGALLEQWEPFKGFLAKNDPQGAPPSSK